MSPWVSQCSISLMLIKPTIYSTKSSVNIIHKTIQKILTYLAYTVSTTLFWNCEVIIYRRRIQRHQPKPKLCMRQTTEELPASTIFQWLYSPVLSCRDSNRSLSMFCVFCWKKLPPYIRTLPTWLKKTEFCSGWRDDMAVKTKPLARGVNHDGPEI